MGKRVRSPNYPALSLSEAVQRAQLVFDKQNLHGAPRDVLAVSMGYNSLNGASATAISALVKYGLLDGRADDIRLSERAKRILFADNDSEKVEALREAAVEPTLFRELSEKFPGTAPSDDVLRNYLLRKGFGPGAVSAVIRCYRETLDFARLSAGAYDSGASQTQERAPMELVPPELKLQPDIHQPPAFGGSDAGTDAGKFRVSMDDDFRIDITATKLDQEGVVRLIRWLEANKELAPPPKALTPSQNDMGENDHESIA